VANTGYEQVTALSTVKSLTSPNLGTGEGVLLQAEGQDIRWRDDGTPPTAAIGMILKVGTTFEFRGNASQLRFIEATAGAKLNAYYF
jgi:hypothetical protein